MVTVTATSDFLPTTPEHPHTKKRQEQDLSILGAQ
jgi:hypothetical protein